MAADQDLAVGASDDYEALLTDLRGIIESGRNQATAAVNAAMVQTYWLIGERIVRQEQQGADRAGYGEQLLLRLGGVLAAEFGRGFGLANLRNMRQFFQTYANRYALRSELSWTHYRTLMRLPEEIRDFYERMTISQRWSSRQLEQQIGTQLHNRVAQAKQPQDMDRILPEPGERTLSFDEVFRDPYVLDFLRLEDTRSERDLEAQLILNIERFLLELGAGFTFMARQQRITIGAKDFYPDLVLYHRWLRCVVVVDLKIGDFEPADVGQMKLYLEWFRRHDKGPDEADPIGLILCGSRDQQVVEYLLTNPEDRIKVSQYLPFGSEQAIREHLARLAQAQERISGDASAVANERPESQ